MKTGHIISLISQIKDKANSLILKKLKDLGIEGLAPSHGDILVALFKNSPLPMKELAQTIKRDKSTVTALINKLSRLGYVEKKKDLDDSRVSLVGLTEKGHLLKPDFEYISAKLISTVYSGFSESEKEEAVKYMTRILNNL